MNINKIELGISQKITDTSSLTDYELLMYAKTIQLLKNQAIFIAPDQSSLPSANTNVGKIYFIENIETHVWSNGTNWLRLFDKSSI